MMELEGILPTNVKSSYYIGFTSLMRSQHEEMQKKRMLTQTHIRAASMLEQMKLLPHAPAP
jgi:hypothetical protein